jgi:hypothetical protein
MMDRRSFLLAALLVAAPLHAHTPYRQWKVLRQRFLLIHSTREDPASDVLAEQLVASLNSVLPQANAMVARAPDLVRVASLMTTGQAVLGIMRPVEATQMFRAEGRFAGMRGEVLNQLVVFDKHVLITVQDFPRHHAWLLASALTEQSAGRVPQPNNIVPVHPGALAFAQGKSLESQENP